MGFAHGAGMKGESRELGGPRTGSPRGAFCMMGVCQECLVRIDGVLRQACLTPVEDGMRVESVDPEGAA